MEALIKQNSQEDKMDQLAMMLLSAIQGKKQPTISIFLSKIYKNNVSAKQKKINSIRLSHLNIILSKAVKNPPTDPQSLHIIYHTIYGVLLNNKNFNLDDGTYIDYAEGYGIYCLLELVAKVMEATSQEHISEALGMLEYLLNKKQPKLITQKQYSQIVTSSQYFSSLELKKEQTKKIQQFSCQSYSLLTTPNKESIIINALNIPIFFNNLFSKSTDKKSVMAYFLAVLKQSQIRDKLKCFSQTFLNDLRPLINQVEAILVGSESQLFDYEAMNEIIRKHALSVLAGINLKASKCEQHFMQSVIKQAQKIPFNSLIETFIANQQNSTYFLFYIIIKYSEKIPKSYIYSILKQPKITNRKGILVALAITQHPNEFIDLIEGFLREESKYTVESRTILLKVVHFALQSLNKVSLFSHILKNIPPNHLNNETQMDFLPLETINREVDKEEKRILLELVKRQFDNTQRTFKMKIDIYFICGQSVPILNRINQVNKIFENNLDTILKTLPPMPEALLDAVLMGINNKLENHYMEEVYTNAIDWCVRTYNKDTIKFQAQLKQYLRATNRDKFYHFSLTLVFYNLEKNSKYTFDPQLESIFSSVNNNRVIGVSFSDYYIQTTKINKNLQSMIKTKSIIVQVKKLLQYLTAPDEKLSNRKDIKTILAPGCETLLALQLINFYLANQLEDNINPQHILSNLLSQIKPQFKFLQELQKRAIDIGMAYYCIIPHLPKLLQLLYPQTINFIAALIKSQITIVETNKNKKKGKKKNQKQSTTLAEQYDKTIQCIGNNIQYLFGDPNLLDNYDNLFAIIDKISPQVDEKIIAVNITSWLQTIKLFHRDNYNEWCQKVINITNMWHKVAPLVKSTITNLQIQRHFSIITDLLNTLYERYRTEKNMLEIEQKLLLTLTTLFNLQAIEMIPEIPREIPRNQLENVLSDITLPTPKDTHYYFCYTCNRSICQICSSFIHRIHDKVYTSKEGNCVHQQGKKHKAIQPKLPIPQPMAENIFSFGRPPIRRDLSEDDDLEHRFQQRWQFYNQLARNQQLQLGLREMKRREEISIKQMLQSRMAMRIQREQYLMNQPVFLAQPNKRQSDLENIDEDYEIKSCSEKQFESKLYKSFENDTYIPAFNVDDTKFVLTNSAINLSPLSNLLLRELENKLFHCAEFNKLESQSVEGQLIPHIQVITNKVVFFKNNIFKHNNQSVYGSRMMPNPTNNSLLIRNVITSNKKLLVFSVHSILLILNIQQIKKKYLKKQMQKKYNEIESENNYKVHQITISGSNFETTQAIFSQYNEESLAVIGNSQIAFYAINSDGKAQKHLPYDANGDNILKFMWVCQAKNIFAYMTNKDIKMGILAQSSSRAKQICQFKTGTMLRDFAICAYKKVFYIHILDVDGNVYRQQFNYKVNNHNLSGKQINIHLKTDLIISMLVLKNNKVLLSMKDGNLIYGQFLPNNQLSPNSIIISLKASLVSAYNQYPSLLALSCLLNMKVIYQSDDQLIIAGILKKQSNFNNGNQFASKKLIGTLAVIQIKGHQTNIIIYNQQSEVDCFEISQMEDNTYLIICMQEDGFVWMCKYMITKPSSIKNDSLNITLNNQSLIKYTQQIKNHLLNKVIYVDSNRYLNFKDSKQITQYFNIDNNQTNIIIRHQQNKNLPFINGISFKVQPNNNICYMKFSFLGLSYNFEIKKNREIQIPLTIKQTIFLFTNGEDIHIEFQTPVNFVIKSVNIFGEQLEKQSVYRESLINLAKISDIYLHYPNQSIEHYLLNHTRYDLYNIKTQDINQTLQSKGYSLKEINLTIKMELFIQSLSASKAINHKIIDVIEITKNTLIPICYNKLYLENSCKKLIQVLSSIYSQLNHQKLQLGHPYQSRTIMDLFIIENYYNLWKKDKTIYHYEQLLKYLTKIISKRVINLYAIIQLMPSLVTDLSHFFKNLSNDSKSTIKKQHNFSNIDKKKISNICSMLISIICQYYQLLKNTNTLSSEKIILTILQSIFCPMKKQINKEVFLHPFQYLQKLHLTDGTPFNIQSPLKLFEIQPIKDIKNQPNQLPIHKQKIQNEMLDEDISQYSMSDQQQKQQQLAKQMILQQDNTYKLSKQINIKLQHQIIKDFYPLNNNQRLIINNLLLAIDQQSNYSSIIYHSFIYELSIQIFSKNDYINQNNAIFYIGLLFNILRIIEVRMDIQRDRVYLDRLLRAIHDSITNTNNAILFMVLNCFISPDYHLMKNKQKRYQFYQNNFDINPTKISTQITKYYLKQQVDNPIFKIKQLNVSPNTQCIALNEALTFQTFNHVNGIYILKYLGSLYLNLRKNGYPPLIQPSKQIQSLILSTVVKNNLRVFRNIMYYQNWVECLPTAKIDVGFERIKLEGVDMIYGSAKNNKKIFIEVINQNHDRIEMLEELVLNNHPQCSKIIEILNMYYENDE